MASVADSPIPLPRSADAQVLADERRRAVYLHVCRADHPLTTGEVAEAFGIHRNAAKHHLDKLLQAGLLRADYRRVNGKRGPGAGRPSKLYSATDVEVSFSVPERHYDLLAHLLLRSLVEGDDLEAVGRSYGARLATDVRERVGDDPKAGVTKVLDELGFQPSVEVDEDGHLWITTENCPFGFVAMEAPEGEVCRLDRAIVAGVLEGFGCPTTVHPHSAIANGGGCCVREAIPQR